MFCLLTDYQNKTYILQYLAQRHDLSNHVVFQFQYIGLDRKDLVYILWLYVLFCLGNQIMFHVLTSNATLLKYPFLTVFIYNFITIQKLWIIGVSKASRGR